MAARKNSDVIFIFCIEKQRQSLFYCCCSSDTAWPSLPGQRVRARVAHSSARAGERKRAAVPFVQPLFGRQLGKKWMAQRFSQVHATRDFVREHALNQIKEQPVIFLIFEHISVQLLA